MNEELFKFLRILVWALPAGVAYNTWGMKVALLTFGCQMFSTGPLTKMYVMVKTRQGPVEAADVQRAYLLLNIIAGCVYAYFVHAIIGGEALPGAGIGG
mgnify:CR=1 FL=1